MNEKSIDELTIKQERKERKLLKTQGKRLAKQKENEKRILEMKLKKDHRITLISKDSSDVMIKSENLNSNFSLENFENNFPSLEKAGKRIKRKNNSLPQEDTNPINRPVQSIIRKTTPITVNIADILLKPSDSKIVTNLKKETKPQLVYNGNNLDASQPERLKGKRREVPKRKQLSKLKSQIISDMQNKDTIKNDYDGVHSPHFEIYCDNIISDDLNSIVNEFLKDVVRFQENLYKCDPMKGTIKRRYIVGLREVKKFVIVKKIKLIIIAPNIKTTVENGALHTVVHDLISLAKENNIPYVFALSRWKLGEITLKFRPISCVGVFNYFGAEQKFNEILSLLETTRNTYLDMMAAKANNNSIEDATKEITQKFISACVS